MIFRLSRFFAIFRFLGGKADFGAQKWKNHPRTAKSALFRFVAKMAPKMTKKALATARFRAHAVILRFGAEMMQKCVLERKGAKFPPIFTFAAQNHDNTLLGRKSERSIAF